MKGIGQGVKEFKNASKGETSEPKENTESKSVQCVTCAASMAIRTTMLITLNASRRNCDVIPQFERFKSVYLLSSLPFLLRNN